MNPPATENRRFTVVASHLNILELADRRNLCTFGVVVGVVVNFNTLADLISSPSLPHYTKAKYNPSEYGARIVACADKS